MASSTPNINLTLPVGSENVSRQVINDNNTKIDTAIGALPSGQNLQGEIESLNDKSITIYDPPSSSNQIDLDNVRSLSYVYVTSNKAYLLNKPDDVQCHVFTVGNGTRCLQYCYDVDNFILYTRSRGGNAWGDWIRQWHNSAPKSIPADGSLAMTIPNNSRFRIAFFGNSNNICGDMVVYCTGSGNIRHSDDTFASSLTFVYSTNTITVTNSDTSHAVEVFIESFKAQY